MTNTPSLLKHGVFHAPEQAERLIIYIGNPS